MIEENLKKILEKQGYRIVGNHSAVKICHWTKERLLRKRMCYKAKFYGIQSHRCLQMSPSVAWCQHKCVFCWRPVEYTLGSEINFKVDEPSFIVKKALEKQKELLSGYWGENRVKRREMEEAYDPKHAAISLAGEPTSYPYLDKLIREFHSHGLTTFLVTNGQNPDALKKVKPTQLYLSIIAHNPRLYKKINNPQLEDGWERLNRSIDIFSEKKIRKVVRITLIKNYNLEEPEKFASLIKRADPDFIEPKGYVHVGYSRRRLERENMPSFEEVKRFGEILGEKTGYELKDYSEESKVVLLAR